MKILLACSQGGHITEMLLLMKAFEEHDIVFLTYENLMIKNSSYRIYRVENIAVNMGKMMKAFIKIFKFLKMENPNLIVSTGSEIAIPTFILGKIMGIRTIYIESWCRVKTKSGTGRVLYYIADVFLVQWPGLVKKYGRKARYYGGVI